LLIATPLLAAASITAVAFDAWTPGIIAGSIAVRLLLIEIDWRLKKNVRIAVNARFRSKALAAFGTKTFEKYDSSWDNAALAESPQSDMVGFLERG
jgi:hypothetical protein